jgi:L-2-hydroxyglutarate oxidase LhgO
MLTSDFLIIGGGIIGLNIARELKRAFSDSSVVLIEKENDCGLHASGRNSGVLHAGFYYTPDSLKAKFTRQGNIILTEYCETRGLPINKCGKLVVARNAGDHPSLDQLLQRGKINGVELEELTEKEAKSIEPRVKTYERAIFSPSTSTVDPYEVVKAMRQDAQCEGVTIQCGVSYLGKTACGIITTDGMYQAGYVVNTAGLYADKIARDFGFSEEYRILPFKGLYLYSDEPTGAIRTNIYPVPDLRNPFLGVHFTVTAGGHSKIGPTAIPAMWRENYKGTENFKWKEFAEIFFRSSLLLALSNFDFKRLAVQELVKYSKAKMVKLAGTLVEGVKAESYQHWGKAGIRAQLVDIRRRKLEMDFVIQGDEKSIHVLNAVSPAFTCAVPFSQYVCKKISEAVH